MISKFLQYFIGPLSAVTIFVQVWGQVKTERHYDKLRKIRNEIHDVEKEIAANEKKEASELYILTNLDLEIDLTQSIVQELKGKVRKQEKEITEIEKNLTETLKELERLKELLSKRLVYFYK